MNGRVSIMHVFKYELVKSRWQPASEEMVEASGDSSLLPLQHFTVIFKANIAMWCRMSLQTGSAVRQAFFQQEDNLHEAGL